jgi:malate/lactate dehydrogenase
MKLGIVGTGNVGCAIALAAVTRGSAREIVLVNRTRKTAEAVATDLRYGTPLTPRVDIRDGDYADREGAGVVLITSGVNEKTGGATDRNDPQGRLKLLDTSARIAEIVLGNEHAAIPIGSYHRALGVTLSLPSIVGRAGVVSVLEPELSAEERAGLEKSAQTLRAALERVRV